MFAERMSKFNLLVNFVVKLREHSQNVRLMFEGLVSAAKVRFELGAEQKQNEPKTNIQRTFVCYLGEGEKK